MESIKTITIRDKTYLIQASLDDKGRVISETYQPIGSGGGSITVDDELSESSENPVLNKIITERIFALEDNSLTKEQADEVYLPKGEYASKAELENKVDKDGNKVLSELNFTTTLKNKLDGIEAQANKYEHPANHPASIITQDATHRFVTDTEKSTWNNKADAENIPDISNLATKIELNTKLNTSTYNSEKANFATKADIGDIETILDNIIGG